MAVYRRPMTYAEERASEMRELDAPLVENYKRGDLVKVDRAWLKHWTFKNAPKPTQFLWRKLVNEGGGVVEKTDSHGNVWVLDRFGQFHGGSFPVPARFVYHRPKTQMGSPSEEDPVFVSFQVYPDGEVIALFPEIRADRSGNCMSYMHHGQHGSADCVGVVAENRAATPEEYDALKRELESIGYRLKIKKDAHMGARGRREEPKPFRVEVIADDSGEWVRNELRFKTHEEAEQYAKDLFSRWTAVREWRVVKGEVSPEMGVAYPPARRQSGPGYDLDLPSMPPFMYVEGHRVLGDLGVIAFGAYNAMGLIGPEKGGVAIVIEGPSKSVLATKDIPYNPEARAIEAKRMIELIDGMLKSSRRGGKRARVFPEARRDELVRILREAGYGVREE